MTEEEELAELMRKEPLVVRLRKHARGGMHMICAEAADEIEQLRSALDATHRLISEGAGVGFNPHDGTWADRLYANQWQIHQSLNEK
jgi:hypothetical protein